MSLSNVRRDFEEDANFIYGIAFVLNESNMLDIIDESDDLLKISKDKNVDRQKFAEIAHKIADKIDKIKCR